MTKGDRLVTEDRTKGKKERKKEKRGLPVGEEFQMSPRCRGWGGRDAARISDEWMGEGAKRCYRIYGFPLVKL